jgi:hypothetical protein
MELTIYSTFTANWVMCLIIEKIMYFYRRILFLLNMLVVIERFVNLDPSIEGGLLPKCQ